MGSLRGKILIASPHMPDPGFSQTVVLMIEHHADGALGLILNRPTDVSLASLWHHLDATAPCPREVCLDYGGPVEGHLTCLHDRIPCSDGIVLDQVYLATQPDQIRRVMEESNSKCRIFCGYAGWGAGQLESELEVGGWLSSGANHEIVFDADVDELWKQSVTCAGQSVLSESLKLSSFPSNPECN